MRPGISFVLAPLAALVASGPGYAVDGVAQINSACATSSVGCFLGDSGGFPVTISGAAGKSYRLTGDLEVNTTNIDVIVISANDVSLAAVGSSPDFPAR